jgi:predicted RNase H-like HicB family nuclease
MQIQVLIEPVPGQGYRATGGEPFSFVAEGATRDDAVRNLRSLIESKVSAGAEIVTLDIPVAGHPWLPFAGMLKGDPLVEEWKQTMAELRRQADADERDQDEP